MFEVRKKRERGREILRESIPWPGGRDISVYM
jgi:hypothetical protein